MTGAPEALQGLTVLLIDDDELDRMSLRRALRSGGIQSKILETSDATQAVELMRTHKVDCAFLDFNMPSRDGLWLVREARARAIRTPLVVLTGQGDQAIAVELMKAGACDYLSKDHVTPERVVASLLHALRVFAAEDALRQSEQRHRLAVEATQLGTWDFDPVSGRLDWSERCKALFGLPPDAATDYALFLSALHPEDRQRTDEAIKAALDAGGGGRYDVEYRTIGLSDGVERWLRATGQAFFDEAERAIRLIGTVQDIGEQKQLEVQKARLLDAERLARERAEAASRMREDLVAIVSHDLRNPLSAITMSADLLLRIIPVDPARAKKQIETIARSGQRMKRLIADLLDVASIDAGKLAVEPGHHDAASLLQEVVEMLQPVASDKSLQLQIAPAPPSGSVRADRERILQVLSNLVGNAIKFTREGGVVVLGAEAAGDEVRFSVADTGAGISEGQMPHLFDRYWQAKRDGRLGIGLGLSIAKGIVEAHGGSIWAESTLGKGTTFFFTLAASELDRGCEPEAPGP